MIMAASSVSSLYLADWTTVILILFPTVLVQIAHFIMFINQLLASPHSKSPLLTGAMIWTLLIVQCFECGILCQSHQPAHKLWLPGEDKRWCYNTC